MKPLVQKLFVIFILIFTLNISVVHSKSLEEIKLLPPDKIRELADTGDAEAQYWLGELIYNGAIDNWQELNLYRYWKMAMEQGHPAATVSLYRYIQSGYGMSDEEQVVRSKIVKSYLIKLANAGEAEAAYLLYGITQDEASDNEENIDGYDTLLRKKSIDYLKLAHELGSRAASETYAHFLEYGFFTEQDPAKALAIFEKAYSMGADTLDEDEALTTCLILEDMAEYYSGTRRININGEYVDFVDAKDENKYFDTLQKGKNHSCHRLMLDLVRLLYRRFNEEDATKAYFIGMDALSIVKAKRDGPRFTNIYHLELSYIAHFLKDANRAKLHLGSIVGEDWQNSLFDEPSIAYRVCEAQSISKSGCRNFLFD